MSAEEIINSLLRNNNYNDHEKATIFSSLQSLNPPIDDETSLELIIHPTMKRNRNAVMGYRRYLPDPVYSYPLTHVKVNNPTFPTTDRKFGASVHFFNLFSEVGVTQNYTYITNHARLNVTDKLTIAMWIKLPASSSGDPARNIIQKSGQYLIRVDPQSEADNKLSFFPYNPTAEPRCIFYYDSYVEKWIHLVCTYDSTVGAKMYVNKVLESSQTDTGSLATTTNALTIGGFSTSIAEASAWMDIAHFTMIHNAVDQTWIDNHYKGILDTTGSNVEITTIPFAEDLNPRPDATFGMCAST